MEVLFEDHALLIVNKAAGKIVEGPPMDGNESMQDILEADFDARLYPCHRLDKDTTGIVIFARQPSVLKSVFKQFEKKQVRKTYLARVDGEWPKSINRVESRIIRNPDGGCLNSDSEGKPSLTTFRCLDRWDGASLLEALPKTGRTHQIRLHCLKAGCPVSGDTLYNNPTEDEPTMALHAWKIRFKHPTSGESLQIIAPIPDYWKNHWLLGSSVDFQ